VNGRLQNVKVLLGVTGSIAAYKACEVLRRLQREGADVRVVMTAAAQRFVAPLTFETLSGHEVITELFPPNRVVKTRHVSAADWADCILVCPATLNCIGKAASGVADDFLSTVLSAARSPVIYAPAMDFQMASNRIFSENCARLKGMGHRFVDFEEGALASGAQGAGRLARPERIVDGVRAAVAGPLNWKGRRVLVTAGPTAEPIDPVRFLTNRSSGKMGAALAEEAALRGAAVTLVAGAPTPGVMDGIRRVTVGTAAEMAGAVRAEWPSHDVLFMAAAVADFTPTDPSPRKLRRTADGTTLRLAPTEDIVAEAGSRKGNRFVVAFALETENGAPNALRKLAAKKADLICLNNPSEPGAGFDVDTNRITILDAAGIVSELPLLPKWEAARRILDAAEIRLPRGTSDDAGR